MDDKCHELDKQITEEINQGLRDDGYTSYPAICHVCRGTGADPMSDIVNWLPCTNCNGKGHYEVAISNDDLPPELFALD